MCVVSIWTEIRKSLKEEGQLTTHFSLESTDISGNLHCRNNVGCGNSSVRETQQLPTCFLCPLEARVMFLSLSLRKMTPILLFLSPIANFPTSFIMAMLPISNIPNHENKYISLTLIKAKRPHLQCTFGDWNKGLSDHLCLRKGCTSYSYQMGSGWPAGMASSLPTTSAATAALNQDQGPGDKSQCSPA